MNSTMFKTLLPTFAILGVAATSSCARSEDKHEPANEFAKSVDHVAVDHPTQDLKATGEDMKVTARQTRDQVVASTRKTLETLGQEIEDVEHWAAQEGRELSNDSKKVVDSLKEQRAKLAAELDRAGEVSEDQWDAFVRETSRAMDKLEAGYNGVLEDMKSNDL